MTKQLLIPDKTFPNNFDIIRFTLAASVILCHSFDIYLGYEKFKFAEPFMVWSHQQISIGSFAVNMFFIISGFLIFKSYQASKGVTDYLKKRVLRIYPGFIVAFLLSLFVVGFIGGGWQYDLQGYKQYLQYLFLKKQFVHLITLQDPYAKESFFKSLPEHGVNNSLWTIQFEFMCYLLVPILVVVGFLKNKWALILLFILTYIAVLLQTKGYIFPYSNKAHLFIGNLYHLPRFACYFLAGACCYFYRNSIPRNGWLVVLSCIAVYISFWWIKAVDQALPLAGTYLLFYLVFHPKVNFPNFTKYGDFSYGVYLYGWPVQALVMFYLGSYINPFSFFFIALPLATIAAFCSWHLVENPFLKLKGQSSKKVNIKLQPATK